MQTKTPIALAEISSTVLLTIKNHTPLGFDEITEQTLLDEATANGKGLQGDAVILKSYLSVVYLMRTHYALNYNHITLEDVNILLISTLENIDPARGCQVLRALQTWNYNDFGNKQTAREASFLALRSALSTTQIKAHNENGDLVDLLILNKSSMTERVDS